MMEQTQAAPASSPALPGVRNGWDALRGTGPALIAAIVLLGVLFRAEVVTAIYTWNDSTAYNHCFLVIPIVGYLIWDRRGTLRGQAVRPMPILALAAVPLVMVWLAAERLGIMEGRQLVAVAFLQVLFMAVFGWRLWWLLSGPLLYLFFAVPFGEFLTLKLQDVTTDFVRYALPMVGIPAYIDGYIIEIPEGTFFIAQACAGLRFLIAAIAFGALYALLMYRSPVRRAVFIGISVVVPIIANGFRALGIVSLGHILGSAEAAAADHIIYGWVFFSFVILLLLACGLPFREDHHAEVSPPAVPPHPGGHRMAGVWAGAALLIITLAGPVTAGMLDRTANAAIAQPTAFGFGTDCVSEPGKPVIRARPPFGGRSIDQRVNCNGQAFDIHITAFSRLNTAGPVMAERRRLTHAPDVEDIDERWLDDTTHDWRMITGTETFFVMAISVWLDGQPSPVGLPMRAKMALASVSGGTRLAPVIVAVIPVVNWASVPNDRRHAVEAALESFLREKADIGAQVRQLAAAPGG